MRLTASLKGEGASPSGPPLSLKGAEPEQSEGVCQEVGVASLPVSSGGAGQVLSPPRGFGIVCLESVLLFASGVSTHWISPC